MPLPQNRELRVLLVTPDYPPTHGGIQRLLHQITTAMPHAETRVLTMGNADAHTFDLQQNHRIDRLNVPNARPSIRNALFNLAAILNAPKWKPDVLLNGHVVTGPVAVALARRYRVANVLYTYGKEVDGRPGLTAWTLRHSDAGITISNFTLGQIQRACGGTLPRPVSIVHPGVAIPPAALRTPSPRPTILTMARLRDWYKGHDKLLEAMPSILRVIPDAQWIVIGEGRIRAELEARAENVGISDSVRFLGAVSDAEKDHWLSSAQVFAMPARYPKDEIGGEGFGIVYLEAGAWGLPSVAGNVGATREAVLDGKTGLLVDPESSEEIAQALIKLLSNPLYAKEMGTRAHERVQSEFRWDQVAEKLETTLRTIVNNRANAVQARDR